MKNDDGVDEVVAKARDFRPSVGEAAAALRVLDAFVKVPVRHRSALFANRAVHFTFFLPQSVCGAKGRGHVFSDRESHVSCARCLRVLAQWRERGGESEVDRQRAAAARLLVEHLRPFVEGKRKAIL